MQAVLDLFCLHHICQHGAFFILHSFFSTWCLHVRRTDGLNALTELLPARIRTRASTPQSWLCPLKLAPCRSGRKNSVPCSSSRWDLTGILLQPPLTHPIHTGVLFPIKSDSWFNVNFPLGERCGRGVKSYSSSHRTPARSGDVAIWASVTGKEVSKSLRGKETIPRGQTRELAA